RAMGRPSGVSPADQRLSRDQKNQFSAPANLDSDEYEKCFPSSARSKSVGVTRVLSPSGKSPDFVFQEAAGLRIELQNMSRDQSLSSLGQRAILSTVKKLESDERLAKGPPLDSAKLANLDARILRLRKIKESVAREVAGHQKDYLRSGAAVKEGLSSPGPVSSLTEPELPPSIPEERVAIEKLKEAPPIASICGAIGDQVAPSEEGSGKSDPGTEEAETLDEEEDSSVADEVQDEADPVVKENTVYSSSQSMVPTFPKISDPDVEKDEEAEDEEGTTEEEDESGGRRRK
ncbi:hypothetical protein U1Q18_014855, partial [Sarracenia purpurea var. burkii]